MTLEASALEVRIGSTPIIRQLSASFAVASWTGLLGANGAGKTTLLRAIAGRAAIAGGSLTWGGRELATDRLGRAQLIGFAVDQQSLPPRLTAAEIFQIVSGREFDIQAHPQLSGLWQCLEIDRILNSTCGTLSTGLKQRVVIMAAFVNGQEIVLLDEPFNWLDPLTAYDFKIQIKELTATHGKTIISAMHDISALVAYCDQGIILTEQKPSMLINSLSLQNARREPLSFEQKIADYLRR